jgi:hypothetical protein
MFVSGLMENIEGYTRQVSERLTNPRIRRL